MSMVGKHPHGISRRLQWDIRGSLGDDQRLMVVAEDLTQWMDFVSSRCTRIPLKINCGINYINIYLRQWFAPWDLQKPRGP
jgi:hypothetical protein